MTGRIHRPDRAGTSGVIIFIFETGSGLGRETISFSVPIFFQSGGLQHGWGEAGILIKSPSGSSISIETAQGSPLGTLPAGSRLVDARAVVP